MPYRVRWRRSAKNALADIWLHASDRQAITVASHRVDQELAVSPEIKGLAFYGDQLLVVTPLHVVYRVDTSQRKVTVLRIWAV